MACAESIQTPYEVVSHVACDMCEDLERSGSCRLYLAESRIWKAKETGACSAPTTTEG